jgi:hypothetical protein
MGFLVCHLALVATYFLNPFNKIGLAKNEMALSTDSGRGA